MDNYSAVIKEFFTASGKGNATVDKFERLLPISIGFLQSLGLGLDEVPTEDQITQLNVYLHSVKNRLGKGYNNGTIEDWKRITKEFFSHRYSLKKKGEAQMTIPETTATETARIIPAEPVRAGDCTEPVRAGDCTEPVRAGDCTENSELTAEEVTQPDEEPEKRKPGRPIKGDEGRDKKITVNIPTSIFNDIKDLANIDNMTFPDCVNTILEYAVNDRWDDIQAIRALRARRH